MNPDINFCGFGILANCNCRFSELLNPLKTKQFETTQTATFVSADSLTTIATGAPVSLTINTRIPDTISSVCGNADGFTACSREIYFTDIQNVNVTYFPYNKVFKTGSVSSGTVTLTLQDTVDSDAGTWLLNVNLYIPSVNLIQETRTATITITVYPRCSTVVGSLNLLDKNAVPS